MYLGLGVWVASRVLLNLQGLPVLQITLVGLVAMLGIWWFRRRDGEDLKEETPGPGRDERIASARIRLEGMEAQCAGRLEQLEAIAHSQRAELKTSADAEAKELIQLNLDRTEEQIAQWSHHVASLKRLKTTFLEGVDGPSNPRLEKVLGPLADLEDLPGSAAEIQRISEQLDPTGSDADPKSR